MMRTRGIALCTNGGTDELDQAHSLAGGKYRVTDIRRATDSGFNYTGETEDGKTVSIREFFLGDICQRDGDQVTFNSKADRALFRKLVSGFVNDAQYLKSLDNPYIALVSDVFEENGTAYMVSVPPEGKTLEAQLAEGRKFKPVEVARIANHLLRALIEIHAFGMLHRDISPRNIMISEAGDAVLLADFSTFREDKSSVSKVVSSVLRAQSVHAPLEFIFEGSEQNEASDIYSLGSVLYLLITGKAPVPCQDRLACVARGDQDPYVPTDGNQSRYDPKFLKFVDLSLALLNEDRVRSASEFLTCFAKNALSNDIARLKIDAANRKPKRRGFLSSILSSGGGWLPWRR